MKPGKSRHALAGSMATHGILVAILWSSLTLAAQPAPRPAEIASSVETPMTLEEPIPEKAPELTPAETDAPLPEPLEEAPPEEPDPFPEEDPRPLRPSPLLPPDRAIAAAAPLPLPARAAPPAPPPPPAPEPVAVAAPALPTRLAKPAPGNPAPRYPSLAIERGIEGTVVLLVSVSADGKVTHVETKVSSGSPLLDREAVRTVSSWEFRPAVRRGRPVECRIEVPIRFRFD